VRKGERQGRMKTIVERTSIEIFTCKSDLMLFNVSMF